MNRAIRDQGQGAQSGDFFGLDERQTEIQILREESRAGVFTARQPDLKAVTRLGRLGTRQHQAVRADHDAGCPEGSTGRLQSKDRGRLIAGRGDRSARAIGDDLHHR